MKRLTICAAAMSLLLAGCGERERESERAADTTGHEVTAVAFNVEGAPTVEFDVPDMMCPTSCAVKTRLILSEQPGVKEVIVDFDTKTATVAVEAGKFDAAAAIAALVDNGFTNSHLKSASTGPTAPDAAATTPAVESKAG